MDQLKRAQEHFTNREPQQQFFLKAFVEKAPGTPKVLSFYGVGGIGKTTLLERCERLLLEIGRPYIKGRINLQTTSFHETHRALIELRSTLRRNHPRLDIPFTRFELGCTVYHRSVYPDVPVAEKSLPWLAEGGEVANVIFSALDSTPLVIVSAVVKAAIALKGKIALILKERRFEEELRQLKEMADAHEHQKIPGKLIRFWAEDLRDYLVENPDTVPVIFIDTIEALWDGKEAGGQSRWDGWVRDLIMTLPEVLWVVFGRDELFWWKDSTPERHRLGDLGEVDSRKFLASCGILAGDVQDTIWAATQGHPFFLDLCVDTWLKVKETMNPEPISSDFAENRGEVLERFLRYQSDKEVSRLKILAVPNHWDKGIFKILLPGSEFSEFRQTLGKQSYIHEREGFPGTWEMHTLMREFLLKKMDRDDFLEKNEALFKYYDSRLEGIGSKELQGEHLVALQEAFHHGMKETTEEVRAFRSWYNGRRERFTTAYKHTILIPLEEIMLSNCERALGPEHEGVAITLNNLGTLCSDLGRREEAEKYYLRSLAIKEKVRGPEHADVALVLNNLGALCSDLGRHEEAEKYYLRSLAIYEKVWGPEHADVAMTVNNLGTLCRDLGRHEEAEKYYLRSLAIYEKVWGPEHADVAMTVNNLGTLCNDTGRHEEAEKYYLRSLAIYEKVCGPEHADVAMTVNNLGTLCNDTGRHEEAEKHYLRSLAIYEKVWGPEHADVAMTVNNLGTLCHDTGRHEEAEKHYLRSLAIKEKVWGLEHTKVAMTLNNLEKLYSQMDRKKEAAAVKGRAENVIVLQNP